MLTTRTPERIRGLVLSAVVFGSLTLIVSTAAASPARGLDQAMEQGWNCTPLILLGGHYHCSPPGKPGVAEIIAGTDVPSIQHQVFRPDGSFAGTELLIRADLFAGQGCPTDQWLPVPSADNVQYWACHHFSFSN